MKIDFNQNLCMCDRCTKSVRAYREPLVPRQLGLPAGAGPVPGDAAAAPRLEHDGPLRLRGRDTRTRAPCRQPASTALTLTHSRHRILCNLFSFLLEMFGCKVRAVQTSRCCCGTLHLPCCATGSGHSSI